MGASGGGGKDGEIGRMGDAFLGEVRAMPFGFVPTGWAPCQGQLLPVQLNAALYSLLGSTYGGDGYSNFALPNVPPLQGKNGTLQYCIAVQGDYPQRP
jgi:microcystin-dependent protein